MSKNDNSQNIQIDSNTMREQISHGGILVIEAAKYKYKQPEIYMVPLHEVEDIAKDDWFLEVINLFAGVILGVAIENLRSSFDFSWLIFGIASVAIIGYRIYRKKIQETKIKSLKHEAKRVSMG